MSENYSYQSASGDIAKIQRELRDAEKNLEDVKTRLAALQADENDPLAWLKRQRTLFSTENPRRGVFESTIYPDCYGADSLYARNFMFHPTREAAERELLLREARFTAWKPKVGEVYHWGGKDGLCQAKWEDYPSEIGLYLCGNIARTEEEMRERVKKYGVLWGCK